MEKFSDRMKKRVLVGAAAFMFAALLFSGFQLWRYIAAENKAEELKALSDELFLRQARSDTAQGNKTTCIHEAEEIIHTEMSSTEEFVIDMPEREAAGKQRQEVARQAFNSLTAVQRRRYWLYHVGGKTEEEIAEMEGATHQAISKSLMWANKKIKKFLFAAQK